MVVDWSGSFAGAFLVAAASAVGVLAWSLVVRKIRPVDWAPPPVLATPARAALAA